MKRQLISATFFGAFLLGTTLTAQAACIFPENLPPNDVSLDGFSWETASLSPPVGAIEVDMNGIQSGLEIPEPWATHGTLVVTFDAAGDLQDLIASWTQNTYVDSVEWVCRLKLEPGTTIANGDGAVTSPVFYQGTRVLEGCRLDLVNDCP